MSEASFALYRATEAHRLAHLALVRAEHAVAAAGGNPTPIQISHLHAAEAQEAHALEALSIELQIALAARGRRVAA